MKSAVALRNAAQQDAHIYMHNIGQQARLAATVLAHASSADKNCALTDLAEGIVAHKNKILEANQRDLKNARASNVAPALLERLALNDARVQTMATSVHNIADLPDVVGECTPLLPRPSGLRVGQMRVPLGVIGIIYESRPNVTADASALCLKAGNAVVLRGGSEALHSNLAIATVMKESLHDSALPSDCVQVISRTSRDLVTAMLAMKNYIDVIVPRGGKGLVDRVNAESQIPVLAHREGICHVFIDQHADAHKAMDIAFNAKTYRYGICGAMETLLVHEKIAARMLPKLGARFIAEGVELRGCAQSCALLPDIAKASEEDWRTEYLAPILSLRVVNDIAEAIMHIARYGSGHTDAIVTENKKNAERFVREVDSSSVMVNAPTCFADGGEYGLGAEIGISTSKLHARGPVGLQGLTTLKYVVYGDGQLRGDKTQV